MTEKEKAYFNEKLEKSGTKNQTDFILALLRNKPIVVYNELVPILVELKRQGNNLNQVARAQNAGTGTEWGVKMVLGECHSIYRKLLDCWKKVK